MACLSCVLMCRQRFCLVWFGDLESTFAQAGHELLCVFYLDGCAEWCIFWGGYRNTPESVFCGTINSMSWVGIMQHCSDSKQAPPLLFPHSTDAPAAPVRP